MRRRLLLLVTLASAVACEAPVQHSGKPPMGRRRPLDGTAVQADADGRASPAAGQAHDPHAVDASSQVFGVADTHLFHRADCPRLQGIARGARITFVSAYDAVDGGYDPCPDCEPFGR